MINRFSEILSDESDTTKAIDPQLTLGPKQTGPEIAIAMDMGISDNFHKFDIRSGIIVDSRLSKKSTLPAYDVEIDFGSLGIKKSITAVTKNYTAEELIGLNIVAIVGGQEALILTAACPDFGNILVTTTKLTRPGSPVR